MSLDIQNFVGSTDPFSRSEVADGGDGVSSSGISVHIRNQQRNGKKSLTTVQGVDKQFDLKKVVKALKKELSCNGTVIEKTEYGSVIQLQGDQRYLVKGWLESEGICSAEQIRVHGA